MNLFLARQEVAATSVRTSSFPTNSRFDGQIENLTGQIQGLTGQVQGLTQIAELLVTNAQVSDRIQDDHSQRIRRLEQE